MARSPRLCILGLDGATWDLILPAVEAGDLPHLARLLRQGAWGTLESTLPPASFPAWSTLLTGANPGRHGIYDFTQRLPGRYEVAFVNATYRRLPSLWQRVGQAGRRVCVMGFPATYPPQPVNGVLISGFDAPVTTNIDQRCVYPPELYSEIKPYPLTDIQEVRIGPDWHRQALERLLWAVDRRTDVALQLLAREPWDLFALYYGASDTVAHHFWAFHDPDSPRYDPSGARQYREAIWQVYRALDQALGRLLSALGEACTVMVVSDHGSGGSGRWIVHLNRWLEEKGWLRFSGGGARRQRFFSLLRRWGLLLPSAWQEWAFRGPLRRWVDRLESGNRFAGIDWEHTAAFSEEVNTLPGIWINLRGREPQGTVEPGRPYERLRRELCAALESWRHVETGVPLLRRAWKREDLYQGPFVHLAPDIVLEPALDRGYSLTFLSSQGKPGRPLRALSPSQYLGAKGGSMNGSHRRDGILLLYGPTVQTGGRLEGASLADVAPTALALLGLAPVSADGRVLQEAFRNELPAAQFASSSESDLSSPLPYDEASERVVRERLRGLGYRE